MYPHSLSYFNESVGGPSGGAEHLLGSDFDWGQNLLYLKRWLDDHPEARPVRFALMPDRIALETLGFEDRQPPLDPSSATAGPTAPRDFGPHSGWFAVSVNAILLRSEDYAYFQHFCPVATTGYAIHIYHITPQQANRVRKELGLPKLLDTPADTNLHTAQSAP